MTCKERYLKEHPEDIYPENTFKCDCPSEYGYLTDPTYCNSLNSDVCNECWNREITEGPKILDSGNRRKFETGAVRDIQEGKGRCDLLPLDVIYYIYSTVSNNDSISLTLSSIDEFKETNDTKCLIQAIINSRIFEDLETLLLEVAKHFEEGCKKYGENNWQKGIPTHCYIDSAIRHYLKYLRGDNDEPHNRAFVWNLICCIWTCMNKPELNDYAKRNEE